MARARVVYDDDIVSIPFDGDRRFPEPATGIIKFPGGFGEVSRCSNDDYWAHATVIQGRHIVAGRIERSGGRLQELADLDDPLHVYHVAIRIMREGGYQAQDRGLRTDVRSSSRPTASTRFARPKITHSDDSVMIRFRGEARSREPTTGRIEFPGGCLRVTRSSVGPYAVLIEVDDGACVVDGRIDHSNRIATASPLEDHGEVRRLTIRVARNGPDWDMYE